MSQTINKDKDSIVLEKLFKKCKKNYVFAAKALLGVEVFTAQKAMLFAMQFSLFIIIVASRGFGKSFLMAVYCVLKCLLHPKEKVGITGPTYRQAKFVFAEIQRLYLNSTIFQESCIKEPTMGNDACKLEFKNGSFIMALPLGDGEKIRGARFNTMIVDESVKVPQEILESSILPMMSTKKNPMESVKRAKLRREAIGRGEKVGKEDNYGNQIIMCTSAWFQIAYLYSVLIDWKKKMDSGDTKYRVLSFSYLEAPEGFFDMDFVDMTKATMSKVRFAMEWLAYWPKDTDGFFPISLFEKARGNFNVETEGKPGDVYGIGIDPARESDNFIITVAKLGTTARIVYTESASAVKDNSTNGWKVMHDTVRSVFRKFNSNGAKVVGIALDQGGGGSIIRDMLSESYEYQNEYGETVVEPRILEVKGNNILHDEVFINSGGLQILYYQHWSTEWINSTAWRLKSMLEKKQLLVPSPIMSSEDYNKGSTVAIEEEDDRSKNRMKRRSMVTDVRDLIMDDIEETIYECSNIITTELPSKRGYYHFTTAKKTLKKDRWAALMLLAHLIYELLQRDLVPKRELANRGVVTKSVIGIPDADGASKSNINAFLEHDKENEKIMALLEANKIISNNIGYGSVRFNADAAALSGKDK